MGASTAEISATSMSSEAGSSVDLSPFTALIFHQKTEKIGSFLSILRWCGLHDVTEVDQIKLAIENIVAKRFDFIFVTHVGDAKETSQLVDELKSLDATSDIPLVAVTNNGELKNVMRILAKGIDEVIVTPLSKESVENVARKILRKHKGDDPIAEKLELAAEMTKTDRVDEAKAIYRELLAKPESMLSAHLGLGDLFSLTKDWKNAGFHLKKAMALAKAAETELESHLQLAEIFYGYGKMYERHDSMEQALKCYKTSTSMNPFHTDSIRAQLELLQKCNEETEIFKLIDEVRDNFLPFSRAIEDVAQSLGNMAEKFQQSNMADQAKKIYENLLQMPHSNVDVHLKVADFFIEEGMVNQVVERFVDLLQKLKDADMLYKTGDILLDIEKNHLSTKTGAKSPEGGEKSFLGDLDQDKALTMAERMFQQGLLLEPESLRFLINLARCYIRRGNTDVLSKVMDKIKGSYAEDIADLQNIITMLLEEKAYDQANIWIKNALTRFPKEIELYSLLSRCKREQSRPYDAIGCLKQGLSINPSHIESIVALAELYAELKEYSDSILYFEKAIKLAPNDLELQDKLKRVMGSKYGK
ncbi:MAG: tetratricopeptide repeat protein [Syntrophobacteraceae bacterium]|nr:tetratricopeptide repeat protein [Syntrophobacteraceae bacterium]